MSIGLISTIILGISIVIGSVAHIILKKKDSVIEQIAEKIIKDQTGIDIDFTPEQQEQFKKEAEQVLLQPCKRCIDKTLPG